MGGGANRTPAPFLTRGLKGTLGDKWSWWVCRTHRWDSGLTHTPNQSWQQNPNVKVFFSKLLFIICKRFFLKDLFVFATGIFYHQFMWTRPHKLSSVFFIFEFNTELSMTSFSLILTIFFLWAAHHMSSRKTKKEFRIPKNSEFRITLTNFQTKRNFCIGICFH